MDDFELLNLPTRTIEHVKNDIARAKFRELFKDPLFIVREETDNDYGVDICIEALANNGKSPTNIRALVQLKSSGKARNADNTYSYSVDTSNLNYLLNTPGSFYVFYAVKEDIFYYCRVDEAYSRCLSIGVKLAKQKTVTVNFKEILTEETVRQINDELIQSAILFKNIRLKLKEKSIQPGKTRGRWKCLEIK